MSAAKIEFPPIPFRRIVPAREVRKLLRPPVEIFSPEEDSSRPPDSRPPVALSVEQLMEAYSSFSTAIGSRGVSSPSTTGRGWPASSFISVISIEQLLWGKTDFVKSAATVLG